MTMMSPIARVTPDDLPALEQEGLFELVAGKLIEKLMSFLASETAGLITVELGAFL